MGCPGLPQQPNTWCIQAEFEGWVCVSGCPPPGMLASPPTGSVTLGTFLRCPGYGSSSRQEDWGGPDSTACKSGWGTGTSGESVQLRLLIVSPRGEVGGTGGRWFRLLLVLQGPRATYLPKRPQDSWVWGQLCFPRIYPGLLKKSWGWGVINC